MEGVRSGYASIQLALHSDPNQSSHSVPVDYNVCNHHLE
jgi:hypothetical protein